MKKCEMETTVNLYGDDKQAHVYSCDPYWIGKLKKLCDISPEDCRLEKTDGVGCFFTLPAAYVKFKPARQLSEKQRAVLDSLHAIQRAKLQSEY
jgi:hypothetical protein